MEQEVLIVVNTWRRLIPDGVKWPSEVHLPSAEAETCFSENICSVLKPTNSACPEDVTALRCHRKTKTSLIPAPVP